MPLTDHSQAIYFQVIVGDLQKELSRKLAIARPVSGKKHLLKGPSNRGHPLLFLIPPQYIPATRLLAPDSILAGGPPLLDPDPVPLL